MVIDVGRHARHDGVFRSVRAEHDVTRSMHLFELTLDLVTLVWRTVYDQPQHAVDLAEIGVDGDFLARLEILDKYAGDAVEVLQLVKSLSEKTELAERAAEQRQQLEDQLAELARAERELRDNNEALTTARELADQANAAKTEFLAKMSHELRTPLTVIKGYIEILANGMMGDLSGQQQDSVRIMHEHCIQLETLIRDLIRFGMLSRGELLATPEPITLYPFFNDFSQSRMEASIICIYSRKESCCRSRRR